MLSFPHCSVPFRLFHLKDQLSSLASFLLNLNLLPFTKQLVFRIKISYYSIITGHRGKEQGNFIRFSAILQFFLFSLISAVVINMFEFCTSSFDKVRLDSIIIIAYYKKILDFGVMEIGCSEYGVTKSDQSFPLCFLFKLSFKIVLFRAKHSRMGQAEFSGFCLPKLLLGPFLNTFSHLSHGVFYKITLISYSGYTFFSLGKLTGVPVLKFQLLQLEKVCKKLVQRLLFFEALILVFL